MIRYGGVPPMGVIDMVPSLELEHLGLALFTLKVRFSGAVRGTDELIEQ